MNMNIFPEFALRPTLFSSSWRKVGGSAYTACTALFVAAASFLPVATSQAAWTNPDTTWPPQASQNWNLSSNWGGTLPTSTTMVYWNVANTTGLINSNTSIARLYQTTGGIWIANGGSLTVSANFEVSKGQLTVENGGSVTATNSKILVGTSGSTKIGPATFSNAGTTTATGLTVAAESQFLMTGGTLATGAAGMQIGFSGSTSASEGKFIQSGGGYLFGINAAAQSGRYIGDQRRFIGCQ